MDETALGDALAELCRRGALFAYLHGSQGAGTARPDSDIDLAAVAPPPAPASFEVDLPAGVDLIVLNDAPLGVAGRIACHGQLAAVLARLVDLADVHRFTVEIGAWLTRQ